MKDATNPRGLWRRTTLDEYRKEAPNWDIVLDLDQLGRNEGENWVWAGAHFLDPANERALVYLSRGGADANVLRKFDVIRKRFITPKEDGFTLPEAKSRLYWRPGGDSLFVGTVFPGEESSSLTDSGYPRVIKLWRRGTPLSSAETVYAGEQGDVSVAVFSDLKPGFERDFVQRGVTFWTNETDYRDQNGALVKLAKPDDAEVNAHRQYILFELRSDWTIGGATHQAGSLLVTKFDAFIVTSGAPSPMSILALLANISSTIATLPLITAP
ncbi:prolyl oligopeptidase [Gonapodya prolifera JEL478]|uniref:Prolyl oligopeptidase n=1 Tax=Gonapodya prolifera (strain JEL478) TaxID=1344416 RepID=A0A139A6G1_GONPJ|nr:prolyl oligopeptidase [Gonapodya prolifera JEL478]|eukprot:KXS11963.1 prolyl oligopeptidase [Gonapodya prolifera JEL478]